MNVAGVRTTVNGLSNAVPISSTPANVAVRVDRREIGNTPLSIDIEEKNGHNINIELQGYHLYEITMSRNTWGRVIDNIIFRGIIGLIAGLGDRLDLRSKPRRGHTPDGYGGYSPSHRLAQTVPEDALKSSQVKPVD